MSTKVYSGFIIRGASTQDALSILGRERPALQKLVDTKNHTELIRRLTSFIDDYCILKHVHPDAGLPEQHTDALTSSPWWHCLDNLIKEQAICRGSNMREPLIDCAADITLYMHPETGHLLGFIQEERLGVYDHLITVPGIQEYGYWNNTDPLEGISEEDWDLRGTTWNTVLDTDTVARVSLRLQPNFVDQHNLLAPVPGLLSRAQRIAKNAVSNTALRNHPELQTATGNMSGIVRELRRVDTALRDPTSATHAEYLNLLEKFKTFLVPNIEEHFNTPVVQLPGLPATTTAAST